MASSRAVHIVIAEDSHPDVILFREALRSVGVDAELKVFSNGEECAEHLRRTEEPLPDLIVIDLNLPKVDGFDLIRVVRGQERYARVPVAVLTSSAVAQDRRMSLDLGANVFITKPSGLDDFMETVGSTIRTLLGIGDDKESWHVTCGPAPKPPTGRPRRRFHVVAAAHRRTASGVSLNVRRLHLARKRHVVVSLQRTLYQ